jgi:hypothetical protein
MVGRAISVAVEAAELCRKAASIDATLLDGEELTGSLLELEDARRLVDAAMGHLSAELEHRDQCVDDYGLQTASWFARETHGPIGPARRRVQVAALLRHQLPVVDDALTDARISFAHAEVLAWAANERIAEEIAALSPHFVDIAREMPFAPWKQLVLDTARRLDADGGYDPDADISANKLYLDAALGGTRHLRGTLVGELGASVAEVIDRRADEIRRRFQELATTTANEATIPNRATLRALALAELCQLGHAADPPTDPDADLPTSTPRWAAGTDLTIIHRLDQPDVFTTLAGDVLHSCDLGSRLCDAAITLLGIDDEGTPLNLGRTQRLANRAQRRAAHARDGGCVFPGCSAPASRVDLHHLWLWDHGGPTDLANLATLCRFHHGITHRHGWSMHASADGWFWWQTPAGLTFWSQRHGQPRDGPAPARC